MKVMISGGGTGGHIYPAISLIKHLQNQNSKTEFLYVGTDNGLEKRIVTKEGIPFRSLQIQGFKRSLSLENVKTVKLFLDAIKTSKEYIKDFKPDIVIGTGGYVCSAVVYTAAKMNIPTMIHEQNSVAGLTNKFLSRYVDKVAICFEDAKQYFPDNKVIMTGNPRGQEVYNLETDKDIFEEYGLDKTKKTILIFGGSRGAYSFNQAFEKAVDELDSREYQVIYVSGKIYYDQLIEEIPTIPNNVVIKPYISDMPEVLSAVDAVFVRSGATTIAEITALGVPSILVPSPNVTNDHQTKNAKSLVDSKAGMLLKDDELNSQTMVQAIDKLLLDETMLSEMQANAKYLGIKDANYRLEKVIYELVNKE